LRASPRAIGDPQWGEHGLPNINLFTPIKLTGDGRMTDHGSSLTVQIAPLTGHRLRNLEAILELPRSRRTARRSGDAEARKENRTVNHGVAAASLGPSDAGG
jgi:hypothetical protein